MADVYRIQAVINLGGNLAPELQKILKAMDRVEKDAKNVEKATGKWGGPVDRATASVHRLSKAMAGIKTPKNAFDKDMGRWGAELAKPVSEMKALRSATKDVSSAARGVSRSLDGWTNKISSAAAAMKRVSAAASSVHMPTVPRALSVGGGGGSSTRSGHAAQRRNGHLGHGRHGPGAHAAHDAMGTYPAAGLPTMSLHYLQEILGEAGGVDQIAELQRVQGGLSHGKPMSKTELNEQVRLNKEAAFAIAERQRYTTPFENMKTITDLADLDKGDYGEARSLLPAIAKLNYLTDMMGDEEVKAKVKESGNSRYLARALDQMGVMAKPEAEQQKYFDAVLQGAIGTRGIFNGRQLFGAVSKSGGTATKWSPEFVGGVLPMLTEQMTGQGAADALYMFEKHMYKGQVSNKREAMAMRDFGLIKDSDFIYDEKKQFKGVKRGAIPGSEDYFKEGHGNSYAFFKDIIKPLLEGKGAKTREEKDKAIDELTFAKNYAKMWHEFLANEANLDANLKRFGTQGDPQSLIDKTLTGQLNQVTQGGKTLGTTIADPQVTGLVDALKALSDIINASSKGLRENPGAAQGAFGVTAAAAGGIAAAGLTTLSVAATTLVFANPLSLAIGAGTAITIAALTIPWGALADALGISKDAQKDIHDGLKSPTALSGAWGDDDYPGNPLRAAERDFDRTGKLGPYDFTRGNTVSSPAGTKVMPELPQQTWGEWGREMWGRAFGGSSGGAAPGIGGPGDMLPGVGGAEGAAGQIQQAAGAIGTAGSNASTAAPQISGAGEGFNTAATGANAAKTAADGAGGALQALAGKISSLGSIGLPAGSAPTGGATAPTGGGSGGAAPATPGKQSYSPPPRSSAPVQVATSLQLDGRTIGRAVTKHQVAQLDTRNGTGRFDGTSAKTPVGFSEPVTA